MITCKVRGDDVEITSDIIEYVNQHVGKLKYLFTERTNAVAYVNMMGISMGLIKAEITISLPYFDVRGEGVSEDEYHSIDIGVDDIKERIELYSDQVNDELQKNGHLPVFYESPSMNQFDVKIVRKKRARLETMDAEEAVLQMNMIGHDFFVYTDEDDHGTNIVYKREDGNYGVIKTDHS